MKETVNIPRESTMQEISQTLQVLAFSQVAKLENVSTWSQLSGLSKNGYLQKIFDYGDQIIEKWTDTAASKEYEFPWQITHFENVELDVYKRQVQCVSKPNGLDKEIPLTQKKTYLTNFAKNTITLGDETRNKTYTSSNLSLIHI